MYPLLGKRINIIYEDEYYKPSMYFLDETILQIEDGITGEKEVVEYHVDHISDGVYMIYWFEPKGKFCVTQIQNLNSKKVISNAINLRTTEFYSMKGTIIYSEKHIKKATSSNTTSPS